MNGLVFWFLCVFLPSISLYLGTFPATSYAYVPALPSNSSNQVNSSQDKIQLSWVNAGFFSAAVSRQLVSDQGSTGISRGAFIHFSETNATFDPPTDAPWVAFINCDRNESDASMIDDIFTLCRDHGAVSAVLYSLTSEACIVNPEYLDNFEKPLDVYSTVMLQTARLINNQFTNVKPEAYWYNSNLLNQSAESIWTYLNDTPAPTIVGGSTISTTELPSPTDDDDNDDEDNSDDSEETVDDSGQTAEPSPDYFGSDDTPLQDEGSGEQENNVLFAASTILSDEPSQPVPRSEPDPPPTPTLPYNNNYHQVLERRQQESDSNSDSVSRVAFSTSTPSPIPSSNTAIYLVAQLAPANASISTASGSSSNDDDDDNNNNNNDSANTGLAMIILYAITGCVTLLFLIVILSGAVRAIRHPERYGPRAPNPHGPDRYGRTRRQGLTKAILDTFPVVKFSDHHHHPNQSSSSNVTNTGVDDDNGDHQNNNNNNTNSNNSHRTFDDQKPQDEERVEMQNLSRSSPPPSVGDKRLSSTSSMVMIPTAVPTSPEQQLANNSTINNTTTTTTTNNNNSLNNLNNKDEPSENVSSSSSGKRKSDPLVRVQEEGTQHDEQQETRGSTSQSQQQQSQSPPSPSRSPSPIPPIITSPINTERSTSPTTSITNEQPARNSMSMLGDEELSFDDTLTCPICVDEWKDGDDVRILPCDRRHRFHRECIDPWLLNVSSLCPLCRLDLRKSSSRTAAAAANMNSNSNSTNAGPGATSNSENEATVTSPTATTTEDENRQHHHHNNSSNNNNNNEDEHGGQSSTSSRHGFLRSVVRRTRAESSNTTSTSTNNNSNNDDSLQPNNNNNNNSERRKFLRYLNGIRNARRQTNNNTRSTSSNSLDEDVDDYDDDHLPPLRRSYDRPAPPTVIWAHF